FNSWFFSSVVGKFLFYNYFQSKIRKHQRREKITTNNDNNAYRNDKMSRIGKTFFRPFLEACEIFCPPLLSPKIVLFYG
ncbi:MAG: hypothetical protein P8163_19815, partial [Candidatus Thiodiazotropha sp.]